MDPVLRITIETGDHVHSGIVLDMEAADKAGAELFHVVIHQLIASYKQKQLEDKQKQ